MTDAQLLTLAVAIVLPLSMLIYSNGRITEARETLRAEMQMGFESIRHDTQNLEAKRVVHGLEHHRK
jgi:hypothetical protein